MQTLNRLSPFVQSARRRSLASLPLGSLATVLPFAVGIAPRPRAPKGGVIVASKFYRGGSFLPASIATPEPAVAPARDVDAEEGPAWTWDAWTDADTWELGPEPDATPARFDNHRLGETVALSITRSAIESGADGAYFRLERENVEAFWGFVGSLGWPAATWRGWLDLCVAGSPVRWTIASDDDGPRPEPATFEPSPDDEANAMGFDLVMAGEDPLPPCDWERSRLIAFVEGIKAALTKRKTDRLEAMDSIDRAEYEAWLDTMAEPTRDIPYAELVEAVGCHAASNPHYFAS